MTLRTSWAVGSDTERILATIDARTAIAAGWTVGTDTVKGRSGFRPGPGSMVNPGAVTATGTPDTNVHIAPFVYLLNSSRLGGGYLVINDGALTQDWLVSHPADSSHPRKDLLIVQQNDAGAGDADSLARIVQVVGTPATSPTVPTPTGSPDYVILATITVGAGVTTITNANIAMPTQAYAVGVGGLLPILSQSERDAKTTFDSNAIYRMDTNWVEIYDGTAWRVQGVPQISSRANTSLITNPVQGQLAFQTDIMQLIAYTGSAWAGAGRPMCKVRQTVVQSLPNATATPVTFDTEDTDLLGMHSGSSSRVTPGIAGWYWIDGNVTYSTNANGIRTTAWQVTGTPLVGCGQSALGNGSVSARMSTVGTLVHLSATDYVEMLAFQSSGAALNTAVSGSEMATLSLMLMSAD